MKKRSLTLLEIMIVIFLITLITGAIGYNMKGALDRGRAFRTEQAKVQLEDLLLFCIDEGDRVEEVEKNPAESLKRHHLAKNSDKLVLDGWGHPFKVKYRSKEKDFAITSDAYDQYEAEKKKQQGSKSS
jgi:hypothetical protein